MNVEHPPRGRSENALEAVLPREAAGRARVAPDDYRAAERSEAARQEEGAHIFPKFLPD